MTVAAAGGGDVSVRISHTAVHAMATNRNGPVVKDLMRRGLKVQAAASRLCPVDTGRLRSSIDMQLGFDDEGVYVDIGAHTEYAEHVELGTSRMQPRPFLRPALQAAK